MNSAKGRNAIFFAIDEEKLMSKSSSIKRLLIVTSNNLLPIIQLFLTLSLK